MDKKFWNNKKVLITGDTGFKGSWLALALSTAGAKIQGLSSSAFNNNEAFYNHLQIQEISKTADVDIRDLNAVKGVFEHFNPEIVFHLAVSQGVICGSCDYF
jgi:CDP-glucose 4,6-dehydratase